jgi:glycosyltransferase involved in cell wall biosynthesis
MKYFMRWYDTVADKIFVMDDNSDDGTRDIVASYPKATLLPCPESGFDEYKKTASLQNEYKKHSRDADWVITCDCDEFIYHPNLRDFLYEKKKVGYRAIKPRGVFFGSKEIPDTDGQLFDAMPYKWYNMHYDKPILFDPKLDVKFGAGCHDATFSDGVMPGRCRVWLYHCCYLSKQWILDHLELRISRMTDPYYKDMYRKKSNNFIRKAFAVYDHWVK